MLLSLTFHYNYSAYLCLVIHIPFVLMFGVINVPYPCSVIFICQSVYLALLRLPNIFLSTFSIISFKLQSSQ